MKDLPYWKGSLQDAIRAAKQNTGEEWDNAVKHAQRRVRQCERAAKMCRVCV
jgi:hypothetical protein